MTSVPAIVLSLVLYLILGPLVGGVLSGIDRKLSARLQGRVGPPLLQPFYDVFKLWGKQSVAVNRVQDFYIASYMIFVIVSGIFFFTDGDLLLVIFTLTLGSVCLVVAAYSSNSPYSQLGAERELLQTMAYEPMLLLVAISFYMMCGSFSVPVIVSQDRPAIIMLPGIFLGLLFILTIKFRKSPFDLSTSHHGHQELVKGITTEFSGKTLAMVEISHWYETVFLLGFVYVFFAYAETWSIFFSIAMCLLAYLLETFIDNTFPRVKWQTALNSTWFITLALGFVNICVIYFIGK